MFVRTEGVTNSSGMRTNQIDLQFTQLALWEMYVTQRTKTRGHTISQEIELIKNKMKLRLDFPF